MIRVQIRRSACIRRPSAAGSQHGATAILVALLLVVFFGIAALAIDIGHLFVVRNELQNAADAGALAGAHNLYTSAGPDISVNTGANQIGYDAAVANTSETKDGKGIPVEVNWTGGNTGDVERGHWSFTTRTFTPNDSTVLVNLWSEDLDTNPDFINAVRVKARREASPAASFFARIFGFENFSKSADAVAYIGFAGHLPPHEADMPIAICKQMLLDENTCTTGRLINSGSNAATHQTGGWTDFCQENTPGCDGTPCQGGTDANTLKKDIFMEQGNTPRQCSNLNPHEILLGQNVAMQTGQANSVFDDLRQCWIGATNRTRPWELTLPVIECSGNNVSPCEKVVGYVTVNVVWVTDSGANSCNFTGSNLPPLQMGDWSCATPGNYVGCWNSFVQYFNLTLPDGRLATYENNGCMLKTIYFEPDCSEQIPTGTTGGGQFGILADIPVLVK